MAAGRVATGFSYPVVAKYNAAGNDVSFSGGMVLARGVSVSLDITVSDDNSFYADNVQAETDNGRFEKGVVKLVVDGLNPDARRFALGYPEPVEVSYGASQKVMVTKDGDATKPPYLGIGYIVRYRCGGEDIYVPTILVKSKFRNPGGEYSTQEKSISWQTETLEADLSRDDTSSHDWRWILADQTSEEAAKAILAGLFQIGVSG